MKKGICVLLALFMLFTMCGCSGGNAAVTVQRADRLMAAGVAGERYAGMVVSNSVVEITRDSSKRIDELYVEVGDTVKAGAEPAVRKLREDSASYVKAMEENKSRDAIAVITELIEENRLKRD